MIKIDASALEDLQESLRSISESLKEAQGKALKGLNVAADVSSILSMVLSFEKVKKNCR